MSKEQRVSRREALRLGGSIGIGAMAVGVSAAEAKAKSSATSPATIAPAKAAPKLRNIIFMVADGMSQGVPTLADPFCQLVRGEPAVWSRLLNEPAARHGYLDTRSANSMVTDSAAAASAWGSGVRVNNGVLNVSPDGKRQTPIAKLLRAQNKRVGLVTTDKITGATPSGFAVVAESRGQYLDIAEQYLDGVDILLGGGRQHFDPESRSDQQDLLARFQEGGYQLCQNRKELLQLPKCDRILGLFAKDTMPYSIDQLSDAGLNLQTPMLAEMAQVALDNLADHDEGFFVMIEGARVDHAAHSNDAAALLHEQITFEDAIGVALEFVQQRDDTLLVISSDHGNANPGLNGFGPSYTKTDEAFARLAKATASFGSIRDQLRDAATKMELVEAAEKVLDATCGFSTTPEIARIVGEALVMKKFPYELAILQRSWVGVLSQVLGNYTGIGFTGTNHTADRTMLTAIGPGADRFSGTRPHTEVFHHFMELLST